VTTPTNPAELILAAAQRHQAAVDAAKAVSAEIAAQRASAATTEAARGAPGATR
jgi:hypothetical protein